MNYTTHQPANQQDSEMLKRMLVDENDTDSEQFWKVYDAPENDGMTLLPVPSFLPGYRCTSSGMAHGPEGQSLWCVKGELESSNETRVCPKCGMAMNGNGTFLTPLRHLPFGNTPTCLGVIRDRFRCDKTGGCGTSISDPIPFKAEEHRITMELNKYIEVLLTIGFTIVEISGITGVGRNVIKDIDLKRLKALYTEDGKLRKPLEYTDAIGIDEFQLHIGRVYATLIVDMRTGHILWVQKGKKKAVVYDFIQHVGMEWMTHVKAVSCDMNSDFAEAFKEKCPHLRIVYDRFHIVKNFNEKVIDEIRKDEKKRLTEEGKLEEAEQLKGAKYILYMSNDTRLEKDKKAAEGKVIRKGSKIAGFDDVVAKGGNQQRYKDLIKDNALLFTCDIIKEKLKAAYNCNYPPAMGRYIRAIIRLCNDSGNKHLMWFGRLLENHFDGVIAFATFHLSNGILEGTNRKNKTVRRKAYGFNDDDYFFLKIVDASYHGAYSSPEERERWKNHAISYRIFDTI